MKALQNLPYRFELALADQDSRPKDAVLNAYKSSLTAAMLKLFLKKGEDKTTPHIGKVLFVDYQGLRIALANSFM